jgi:predicted RNase H-like nuclease (RuvC/YqgF family)
METITGPMGPTQSAAPSGDQQDTSAAVFEGYIESYEKQILGLEITLAGTAIYTMGQIEQLQQSIIEKFLDRLQTIENDRQEQQQKQEQEQNQNREQKKGHDMQEYIEQLERTVRELQKQIKELQGPKKE